MSEKRKAVFLDRDGVLNNVTIKNGKPHPPASLAELIIPDDVSLALAMLRSAGFMLIGATNQPDVARGTTDKSVVEAINATLMAQLPLTEIRVCYHDDAHQCQCRKPLAGLLLEAANEHGIDLSKSVMVGDRWKDISAGQAAGCKTVWINRGYTEAAPESPNAVTQSLLESAQWILRHL